MHYRIIGRSNLGLDLIGNLLPNEKLLDDNSTEETDILIYTPGGHIGMTRKELYDLNFNNLNIYRKTYLPKRVYAFSSNAVIEPWRTDYAMIKALLEMHAYYHLDLTIFRVGSLYGRHFPERCFPYKVLRNRPASLPTNPITPTPTEWLAKEVLKIIREKKQGVFQIKPFGQTTPHAWAAKELGVITEIGMMDSYRPYIPMPELNPNAPHWLDLWKKYSNIRDGKFLNAVTENSTSSESDLKQSGLSPQVLSQEKGESTDV